MNITIEELKELKKLSSKLRIDILELLERGGSGHIGGSFSCLEILISLYYKIMNNGIINFTNKKRDRFILSKGHAELAMYAIL